MAQTNFTPISLYYSATAAVVPTAGNLVAGELALNTNDGKLYYKDSAGVVQVLATKAGSSGSFGALTATSITDSGLTSGRVTYAGTAGLLQDDADFTFNGTTVTMANDASISGLTVGKGGGAVTYNAVFGASSIPSGATGAYNTAIGGTNALAALTTGQYNTAVGSFALASNTTQFYNTAVGHQAGYLNTTGGVTAVGTQVLFANTTGANNVGMGGSDGNGSIPALRYNTTGSFNTAYGGSALGNNTTASNNTAVGYQAGYSNTTGAYNVFLGRQAGYGNTSAQENTGVGNTALYSTTTGAQLSAFGSSALYSNTTGANNTALGNYALFSNTTASNNTAVGYQAGYSGNNAMTVIGYKAGYANTGLGLTAVGVNAAVSNTSGNYVTAIGDQALIYNTTGSNNSAVGYAASYYNTTGSSNTSLGYYALFNNTTASNNVAVGYQAGYSNTTGTNFTAMGYKAGYSQTTVNGGTYFGTQAGQITTGEYNTMVGAFSGYFLTTGTGNTFVGTAGAGSGSGCGGVMTTGSKNTILGGYSGNQGGLDIRTASNYIVLSDGDGNPRIYQNGSWTVLNSLTATDVSGALVKNGDGSFYFAKDNSTGAAFGWGAYQNVIFSNNKSIYVQAQSGGVYLANGGTSWTSTSDERLKENLVLITDATNKVSTLRAVTGNLIADENKKSRSFLIAQDVQKVLPEAVNVQDDEMQTLGVSYTDVIPLLVAAIQELKAEVDSLKQQLGK
jgi:hypothetical protein